MKLKLPIILTLAGIGLYFYSRATAAKSLKINFKNIKLESAQGLNLPNIIANFTIINPTNTPIKIDSIVGDLFVNNKFFATVSQTNPITISSQNSTNYPIKIQTGIIQAVYTIVQLIRNHQKLTVRFTGNANSTGLMVPINETVLQLS